MEYENFRDVLEVLNQNQILYVILRNYDNLLEQKMYMNGHGDVDMLVEDSYKVADILGAKTYQTHGEDGTHYYVIVNRQIVSLDLRHIGDGYYCKRWQQDMLKRRVKYNGFFVMNAEDYFYSLIYHAILQKPIFSEEYRNRLYIMAKQLGVVVSKNKAQSEYICYMEHYMRTHGYTYTYPNDIYVPLYKKGISLDLLDKEFKLALAHRMFNCKCRIIDFIVKCKHLLLTGKFKY